MFRHNPNNMPCHVSAGRGAAGSCGTGARSAGPGRRKGSAGVPGPRRSGSGRGRRRRGRPGPGAATGRLPGTEPPAREGDGTVAGEDGGTTRRRESLPCLSERRGGRAREGGWREGPGRGPAGVPAEQKAQAPRALRAATPCPGKGRVRAERLRSRDPRAGGGAPREAAAPAESRRAPSPRSSLSR